MRASAEVRQERLQAWEVRAEPVLMCAAVLFLAAYAVPVIWPAVAAPVREACGLAVTATWIVLGVDYLVRLVIAPGRWAFVRSNLLDLAALALPILRPLRLLRLVALLSVLNRAGVHTLRGRVATYVAGGSTLLVLAGALAITEVERQAQGGTIHGFGDGLWWAISTMTTVGYGDRYPVTTTGRFVALALMIGGVALLGVVTATLASWLVERVRADSHAAEAATRAQVEELTEQIRALDARLARLTAEDMPAPDARGPASSERPDAERAQTVAALLTSSDHRPPRAGGGESTLG